MGIGLFSQATVSGQEEMVKSCTQGGLEDILGGKNLHIKGVKHWNGPPRGVMESPSLKASKKHEYGTLGHGLMVNMVMLLVGPQLDSSIF